MAANGDFGHVGICLGGGAFMDSWGAGPFIIEVKGKSFRFEDSDRFGPSLVNLDGSIKSAQPGGRSPFWPAWIKWRNQGRRLADDGVKCIWDEGPPPRPTFYRKIGRHKVIIQNGDDGGKFIELINDRPTPKPGEKR